MEADHGGHAGSLTETQRRIVDALSRPLRDSGPYASPATNQQIADEVFLSVDAVKGHLRALYAKVGIDELPQNRKRARLAELAIRGELDSAARERTARAEDGGEQTAPRERRRGSRSRRRPRRVTAIAALAVVAVGGPAGAAAILGGGTERHDTTNPVGAAAPVRGPDRTATNLPAPYGDPAAAEPSVEGTLPATVVGGSATDFGSSGGFATATASDGGLLPTLAVPAQPGVRAHGAPARGRGRVEHVTREVRDRGPKPGAGSGAARAPGTTPAAGTAVPPPAGGVAPAADPPRAQPSRCVAHQHVAIHNHVTRHRHVVQHPHVTRHPHVRLHPHVQVHPHVQLHPHVWVHRHTWIHVHRDGRRHEHVRLHEHTRTHRHVTRHEHRRIHRHVVRVHLHRRIHRHVRIHPHVTPHRHTRVHRHCG